MSRYLDYNSPITPGGNFLWAEYALLHDWNTLLIPADAEQDNAKLLFSYLQPLRQQLGKPMVISSGARSQEYTAYLRRRGIPAAPKSAHNEWKAVDLYVPNMRLVDLWEFFNKRWAGRMENLHFTPSWIHLDTRNWGHWERFNP